MFFLAGDFDAEATFAFAQSGRLQDSVGDVVREPGTLSISGTVTSAAGTCEVDVIK